MHSLTLTPNTVEIKGAIFAKYGDDTATLDFDGSGNISNSSNLVSFKISTDSSDLDAIKLDSALGGIDIDAKTKINIKAENNRTDAIVLNASAGGIDIDSSGILALDSNTRIFRLSISNLEVKVTLGIWVFHQNHMYLIFFIQEIVQLKYRKSN